MRQMVVNFYEAIRRLEDKEYLKKHFKYQLSPVIKGVKPSVTITIGQHRDIMEKWNLWGDETIKELQLEYVVLRKTEKAIILLIYKNELIEAIIKRPDVGMFLKSLGYTKTDVKAVVHYLVERYSKYNCPHELGIFLGIPLEDVKDYMSCTQKECMFCGYWKVYNNLEESLKTFELYDRAREQMLLELGKELQIAL